MSVAVSSPPLPCERHAQVFVCLPCYNEAENLRQLLPQIHAAATRMLEHAPLEPPHGGAVGYQILAVDDGSTDQTRELLHAYARFYSLVVVSHRGNQGLAEVYRTLIAMLRTRAEQDDIAVFMDADCTHSPQDIAALVKAVTTRADVAVASRYTGGTEVGVPLQRRILSRVVNWLIRNVCRVAVRDCTCGFRAYRFNVLAELPPLEAWGFEVSAEVLIHASRHRPPYMIEEVPFTLRYDRKAGASKLHVGQTVKAYGRLLRRCGRGGRAPSAATKKMIAHKYGLVSTGKLDVPG
jgi:dolichol-phosphate mannosyltransferase